MSDRYINRAYPTLQKFLKENVARDKLLAKETTMRTGGPAAIFATADSFDHLNIVLQTAKDWGIPLFIIGKGSNILVSDAGFPGIVLRLGIDFMQKRIEGTKIRAGAAATLPSLSQVSVRHSLEGLSFAVGIPGSLGGALKMNAGANGWCMGDLVKSVVIYTKGCEFVVLGGDQLKFEYRRGNFNESDIIVEATLGLRPGDLDTIKHQMEENFAKRKSSQPLQFPNAGSVFKNPKNSSAGKLIDEAGCKGMKIGDAEVSDKHANFIINRGRATSSEVYALIRAVQRKVYEIHGVVLEPEIELLGEFEETLMSR